MANVMGLSAVPGALLGAGGVFGTEDARGGIGISGAGEETGGRVEPPLVYALLLV